MKSDVLHRVLFTNMDIEQRVLGLLNSFTSEFEVKSFDASMDSIVARNSNDVLSNLYNYVSNLGFDNSVVLIGDFGRQLAVPEELQYMQLLDGFSKWCCAVIYENYPENVAHELMHSAFGVEECYDTQTLKPLQSCADEGCVMRHGNKNGIQVCSSIRRQVKSFEASLSPVGS